MAILLNPRCVDTDPSTAAQIVDNCADPALEALGVEVRGLFKLKHAKTRNLASQLQHTHPAPGVGVSRCCGGGRGGGGWRSGRSACCCP